MAFLKFRWKPLLPTMFYGLARAVSLAVPYILSKPLQFDDDFYHEEMDVRLSQDVILNNPLKRSRLLGAYADWAILQCVLVAPTFWLLVRCHAQELAGPSIVTLNRLPLDDLASLPRLELVAIMVRRTGWSRLARMILQLTLVWASALIVLGLCFALVLSQMEGSDFLIDWFVRSYLDFRTKCTFNGMVEDIFFWLLPQNVWYDKNSLLR